MKYTLSFISLCLVLNMSAQEEAPVYYGSSVVPPSPTSASLGKYGDVPVGLYTGIPNITIPIYNISEGNLSVPISLSYHSQGFKVEETASWVGLGWSLNAGGTISRAVKGVPDDFLSGFGSDPNYGYGTTYGGNGVAGYLSSSALVENMYASGMSNSNSSYYAPYLAYGGLDGEPDMFFFNFPGGSGQFMFDKDGTIRLLSQQNLKFSYTRSSSTGPIIKFEIVDGNGNIYTFDEIEQTKTISYTWSQAGYTINNSGVITAGFYADPENNQFYSGMAQNWNFLPLFNSSWHLTKIQNATKNHEVNFSYVSENQQYLSGFSVQYRLWDNYTNTPMMDKSWKNLSIAAKRLSSISWGSGSVNFTATTNRDDLNGTNEWPGASYPTYPYSVPTGSAQALTSVEIKDIGTNRIKKYNFGYSYFLAANASTGGPMFKKLKLNSFTEQNNDLSASNPPYTFQYDTSMAIAPRFSQRQDFWGYLKATAASGDLYCPKMYDYPTNTLDNDFMSEFSFYQRSSNNSSEVVFGSYDRSPELSGLTSCVLTQITYPTKGSTSFEFEAHDFYMQSQSRAGGGLRIKKTTDYDGIDHANDIIKNYSYKQSANPTITSGKVLTLPVFAKRGWCSSTNYKPITLFNTSIAPLGSTQGSFVGYSEVTVEFNGNGKKLSKFHLPASVGVSTDECSGGSCIYNRTSSLLSFGYYGSGSAGLSCLQDNFPYADNPNYDWNRGALLEEDVYDNLGHLVQKTENEYTIKDFQKINTITTAVLTKNPRGLPPATYDDYWVYYKTALHYYLSGWKVLNRQTVTKYDISNGASHFNSVTNFYYDNAVHKQVTRTTTTDSKSQTNEVVLKRCLDYGTATGFLSSLNTQNRLNEVIEKQVWLYDYGSSTNRKLIGTGFTEYKDFSSITGNVNAQVLPFKSYGFDTDAPVVESGFTATTFSGGSFTLDSRYRQLGESAYDSKDNLVRSSAVNTGLKNHHTNIFGHGHTLLIATVSNASETDCGFTSFESDDAVLWTYPSGVTITNTDGHCGKSSCYIPGGTTGPVRDYVPAAEVQNKKFILSCWVKTSALISGYMILETTQNSGSSAVYPAVGSAQVIAYFPNTGGTWKYIETEIDLGKIKSDGGLSPSTPLAIRSIVQNAHPSAALQVDDLRFYPKEARMSSYTYQPLVGATSVSDENSNCRYYEYDLFGRLKLVKDQNGKILERTEYNYKP